MDTSKPFLKNLSEDPLLNGKVLYGLTKELTTIGKKGGNPTPDIIIGGIGINMNHSAIENINGQIFINQVDQLSEGTFVNGINVTQKTELFNGDRIIFGMHSTFIIYMPEHHLSSSYIHSEAEFTYEKAQLEMMNQVDKKKKIQEEQAELER